MSDGAINGKDVSVEHDAGVGGDGKPFCLSELGEAITEFCVDCDLDLDLLHRPKTSTNRFYLTLCNGGEGWWEQVAALRFQQAGVISRDSLCRWTPYRLV